MARDRNQATAQFWRMVRWIMLIGVLMVAGALTYIGSQGNLRTHVVVATTLGVFFSTVLGCGLFALAFFSDKSGHDANVSESTRHQDEKRSS